MTGDDIDNEVCRLIQGVRMQIEILHSISGHVKIADMWRYLHDRGRLCKFCNHEEELVFEYRTFGSN